MSLLYALGEKAKKNKKSSCPLFMEYKKKAEKKPRQRARFFSDGYYKKL
jgi:hypothetical protein